MDTLGVILWYSMFVTPLITIPLIWKFDGIRKIYRVIIALVFATILSFFLGLLSYAIIFRDGMGPT